jgi:uncharacterized protein
MTSEFWREKSLTEMTTAEWESLCDGCAQCCRLKLEDADTGDIAVTSVVCRLLDIDSCRCRHYDARHRRVPDCIRFDAELAGRLTWLPETCAYRLLAHGQELPVWHPLRTGDPGSVHRAGMSVRHRVLPEDAVAADDLEFHVLHWVENPARRSRARSRSR